MATDPAAPRPREDEYPGAAVLGAVLATFFFPIISLIAALLLMGSAGSERKRSQLRTWAIASAGWLALQFVIFVIAVAAIRSSGSDVDTGGPCQGGPQLGFEAEVQPDGTYVIPCEFGGSVTMRE